MLSCEVAGSCNKFSTAKSGFILFPFCYPFSMFLKMENIFSAACITSSFYNLRSVCPVNFGRYFLYLSGCRKIAFTFCSLMINTDECFVSTTELASSSLTWWRYCYKLLFLCLLCLCLDYLVWCTPQLAFKVQHLCSIVVQTVDA